MGRMQRGRAISLGGSAAVGGRPAAAELRARAVDPRGEHVRMLVGGKLVGVVIYLPIDRHPGRPWFWCLRDGAASGYEASREAAFAAFAASLQKG